MDPQVFQLLVDKIDKVDKDVQAVKADTEAIKAARWKAHGMGVVIYSALGFLVNILIAKYGK